MVTESIEVADMEKSKTENTFDGLTESSGPLGMCRTNTLPPARTLEQAGDQLQLAINDLKSSPPGSESGILRLQVPLLQEIKALEWIQSQPQGSVLLPRCYFSSRCYRGSAGDSLSQDIFKKQFGEPEKNILKGVAGIGSAVLFKSLHPFSLKDWKTIRRFLSDDSPLVRAYGTIRFNSEMKPSTEWSEFGSFYFVIPQMELDEFDGNSVLAATIAWDNSLLWTFNKGLDMLELTLHQVSAEMRTSGNMLHLTMINKNNVPDEHSWDATVHKALELINSSSAEGWKNSPKLIRSIPFLDLSSLSKVVLARRSKLEIDGNIDPFQLISTLQENDQNAYQFCFQLPKLSAFIGSTPEKLFYRNDSFVSSEAVAGTRARGHNSMEDLQIGLDLLYSSKDHREFEIVKEIIKEKMETICKYVSVESEKSLIKQTRVQHLYARLIGELKDEAGEFSLLSLLHPTPAVCGHPQEAARNFISQNEIFDRGMYAGPVGWFGGKEAEFAVGIRSALMQKNNLNSSQRNKFPQGTCLYLYAGAGIVKGSMPSSEWQELDLKASQFEELFQPNHALQKSPNISGIWASLSVKD